MSEFSILVLTVLKTLTVLLGLAFLYYTGRAYKRRKSREFALLFVAIALLTVAAISEGLAFQGLKLSLDDAHVIEGIFTLAGFAVLVYSVVAPRRVRARNAAPPGDEPMTPR
jgi:heme A synthase